MIPEASGQGESAEATSEISESPELTFSESTAESTSGGQPTGYNPSWNEAFEAIPDVPEFHEKLKPVFEKWEKNQNQRVEQVQQEYAPYKILAENKVSIDDVRNAFELRNQLAQNPQEVFNRLAQHLGFDLSKLNAGGDESQGLDEYPDGDEELDPRYAKLKADQDAIRNYLQTQAQQEETQRAQQQQEIQEKNWYEETRSTLDSLEEKHGPLDRNRVVQFAVWESEKNGGEVDLEKGLIAMREFASSVMKTSANANAPMVFSGNGALASGRVDTSKMNDAEFEKYAIERIRAKNGG